MPKAPYEVVKDTLLDAALIHVAFDGWSETTFRAAIADAEIEPSLARSVCPRGAIDLAIAFHKRGDAEMVARIKAADMSGLRFRDKIAASVRHRIEAIEDKEAVRRGSTLFALPHLAADGAKLVWGTVDLIWETLGDSSDDLNWYTKRGTLAGVYGATVLFWLGDDSLEHQATWEFLDRRIENVMQIETVKAQVKKSPVLSKLLAGPNWALSQIKAPARMARTDVPGAWFDPQS